MHELEQLRREAEEMRLLLAELVKLRLLRAQRGN